MGVQQQSQAFIEKDGDLEFDHTKIIVKGPNDQYFYTTTRERTASSVDINQLELTPIPVENIWPQYSDKFTKAPDLTPSKYYIKEPNLLSYGTSPDTLQIRSQMMNEILVYEILKDNPHPNIAIYTGCVVSGDLIRGLCFMRYKMTLAERLRDSKAFDHGICLREIEAGIRHLHSLGLVHNDINPSNIMISENDRPVIIDFDTCYQNGEKLGSKAGTWGWFSDDSEFSKFENDFLGLAKLREYVLR